MGFYGISTFVVYLVPNFIYIYIYHHHHVALVARISLTLSRHSSLSFIALGRSSGQHPVSSHSCWMVVLLLHGHVWGSIRVHLLSKVGDLSQRWSEGSLFQLLLHRDLWGGLTPFPGLVHFSLDPYLIVLSVKESGFKHHFLSFWYDSNWDLTPVSRTIGEHSTH